MSRYEGLISIYIEFHSISNGTVTWIEDLGDLTQWHLMDLIEIDGFDSLLVRQFARQPLANMDLLIYFRLTLAIMFDQSCNLDRIATIIYRFLYLLAKIVYLLVLNMLLEPAKFCSSWCLLKLQLTPGSKPLVFLNVILLQSVHWVWIYGWYRVLCSWNLFICIFIPNQLVSVIKNLL